MALHPPAEDEETASGKTPSIVTHGTEEDLGFHPTVQELMKAIISDPEINVFFNQIFWQQYKLPGFSKGTNIPSWQLMIILIDHIMTSAPEYNNTDLVVVPINGILNWPMVTTAGFAAFLNDKVNTLFKVFSTIGERGKFLSSSASCYVLNEDPHHGWFGEDVMQAMPNFDKEFKCKPKEKHHGFTSWMISSTESFVVAFVQ